jgi:hypothetical protein
VDCYYPVGAEAVYLIVGLKNMIGFGFAYAIVPWLTAWGDKRSIGTITGIMFACMLLWVPLFIFGKKLRFAAARWKLIIW